VVLVGPPGTKTYAQALGVPDLLPICIDTLKRAYKAGVAMAFGTDMYIAMPSETRGTLAVSLIEGYVEAGVPAKVILQTMTINAARLLSVEKERGAIKPGLAADIIATRENPLDNVLALKQVRFVMKDGKVFKHSE
jgi:imidazolonepropionase-like amidohydrolase